MMEYVLPVAVFVLIGVVCLMSVLVFKMSSLAVESSQRSHDRSNDYNKDLLDRLMAVDWNTYKALTRKEPDTHYEEPPPVEEEVVARTTTRGGFGSGLGLVAMAPLPDEEVEELDEDR